ncbi:MAG: hypothetical protein K9J37_18570 [Saprospiraceae bacterium]|nr:hypothetical protein [Saprospiraceae bacterium]MCF8251926.1 hypothetical protein [Saprospiraceae bacterium]MCF8281626.1 hypothetical protein [Bacteroidales bacterium]MCF8313618.1 hypothetical protein [Saprospiraceae bacterium]MCF8442310.1 hypothetical protein [Saprospiraceae bacterium]
MTAANLTDREMLKSVVLEVLRQEPALLKSVVREVLVENNIVVSTEQAARRKEIEAMILEDFDEIGDVYKALA